jgi:DNA adenine methylase
MNLGDTSIPIYGKVRPILRWAGSKRKLVPLLLKLIPAFSGRYFEPFAGSACLFTALRPSKGILGDRNGDLIRTYETIRSHPTAVARMVHAMPKKRSYYYDLRRTKIPTSRRLECAAQFLYLNRYCFNGVYRTNKAGDFNVPRGTRTGRIPRAWEFAAFAEVLRTAELRCCDFEECLRDVRAGDFVYLDPPFPTKRPNSGEYGYGGFGWSDIERLIATLRHLDANDVSFLLSFVATEDILKLNDWFLKRISVGRHVAGFSHHRTRATEILVSNRTLPCTWPTTEKHGR